ncbi:hypothetical protein C450_01699 [Halococcus salifodinae DSM 8989]|uniref:Uncharacterized protein n=1 Tax=Halococcus salifodinae DSM 8989 TaxID=1227456 RepID=M0NFH7_9EURY|nr:hypothetical protein C450_01699 [Halococcus salifodinae DSM 8989]
MIAGVLDELDRVREHVLASRVDFSLDVAVARGHDEVDPVDIAVEREIDIAADPAAETRHSGVEVFSCYPRDRLALARTGAGAAGLDDRHAGPIELPRDVDLLVGREGHPWGLFAVAERGIEKLYVSVGERSGFGEAPE